MHACIFDLKTGILKDLGLNFEEKLKEIQKIYDLTSLDSEDSEDQDF